jgi:hypothetical protein
MTREYVLEMAALVPDLYCPFDYPQALDGVVAQVSSLPELLLVIAQ